MIVKVVPISSELELQLKNWVLELELEPSVLRELSQDRGSDSAFRKGLHIMVAHNGTHTVCVLLI